MPPEAIFFLDQYSGLSGGQKVLLDVTGACAKKGWRCVVGLPAAGELAEKLQLLGIRTIVLPLGYYTITRKNFFDLFAYAIRLPLLVFLTIRIIKKERICLVYANGARTFPWATLACAATKTPLIWHVHSIFARGIEQKSCLLFGSSKIVRRVFAVSGAAAAPLSALGKKVLVLYNAVECTSVKTASGNFRKEYGLDKEYFCVAAIAILEDWKNQEDLIRAAEIIKNREHVSLRYFLIGDSLNPDNKSHVYKTKLKKLVAELSLGNEIIFTGFRSDVKTLLPSLNALVICSKIPDPCPLVALEAACASVPLISTGYGGIREIFVENEEALFYQARDPRELAEQILYLYHHPDAAMRIGEKAQQKVARHYRMDVYLETVTQEIATVADGNKKTG